MAGLRSFIAWWMGGAGKLGSSSVRKLVIPAYRSSVQADAIRSSIVAPAVRDAIVCDAIRSAPDVSAVRGEIVVSAYRVNET